MSVYKHDKATGSILAGVPAENKISWLATRVSMFLRTRPRDYFTAADLMDELGLVDEQRNTLLAAMTVLDIRNAVYRSKDSVMIAFREFVHV